MTARYNAEVEEKNFRVYLADSLYLQGKGEMFQHSFSELTSTEPKDDRDGNEIARDIMTKFGLTFKQGG